MRDGPRDLVRLVQAIQARGPLPADLAGWVIDLATAAISDADRKQTRNYLLRQAGAMLGGSSWKQAAGIRTQMLEVIRLWSYFVRCPPPPGSLAARMIEILTIDPGAPTSMTQLWRILGDLTFIEGVDESERSCDETSSA